MQPFWHLILIFDFTPWPWASLAAAFNCRCCKQQLCWLLVHHRYCFLAKWSIPQNHVHTHMLIHMYVHVHVFFVCLHVHLLDINCDGYQHVLNKCAYFIHMYV